MSSIKVSSEGLKLDDESKAPSRSKSKDEGRPTQLSKKHRLVITAALYFCYFAYGLAYSLIGATLLDLAENTNSTFESVTQGLVARSISYCLGSLAAGFAYSHINRELGFAFSLLGLSAAIMGAPFFRNLYLYLISELFVGFFGAGVDVAPNTWILEIWQAKSNSAMQGMHSAYAIGQMMAPIMLEPFLSSGLSLNVTTGNASQIEGKNNVTESRNVIGEPSRIVIPYSIASATLVIAAIGLFVLYFKLPHLAPSNEERNEMRKYQSDTMSENTKWYRKIVITLGCLLFLVYSGIEFNSFTFFVTFAVSIDLHLSKSKAAMMSGLFSFFYAVGRLASIYVATKMKTTKMLGIHLGMIGIGNILLWIFCNSSEVMVWISIAIMGYGYSCMCPAFYSFLEDRINVTSTICGWFMFFSTISSVAISFTIGKWMQTNPLSFVYTNVICLIFCYVVFALFFATDRRFKRGHKIDNGQDPSVVSSLI